MSGEATLRTQRPSPCLPAQQPTATLFDLLQPFFWLHAPLELLFLESTKTVATTGRLRSSILRNAHVVVGRDCLPGLLPCRAQGGRRPLSP